MIIERGSKSPSVKKTDCIMDIEMVHLLKFYKDENY